MSIINKSELGWLISHEKLVKEIYSTNENDCVSFRLKPDLFAIKSPYKAVKNKGKNKILNKEINLIRDLYDAFYNENKKVLEVDDGKELGNESAVAAAKELYSSSGRNLIVDVLGANHQSFALKEIGNKKYLFPENCTFYSKDVEVLNKHIPDKKFDLILLDPPWWNKYIRRKRKHTDDAYHMMYNEDLKKIPLKQYLLEGGLVVVWCTNSNQNLTALYTDIFQEWGVKAIARWYWVKITRSGAPVCDFAEFPRKQPFEQIIIASNSSNHIPTNKLVVSVPSALHSHKPPLTEILKEFLPENAQCLEIFARYLLPNWTSYGNEVLRLQHESLYSEVVN